MGSLPLGLQVLKASASCLVYHVIVGLLRGDLRSISIGAACTQRRVRVTRFYIDASFHPDVSAGSTGAVLRDFECRFVAATTSFISHVVAQVGVTLAIRMG
jgi:hypothetical protein